MFAIDLTAQLVGLRHEGLGFALERGSFTVVTGPSGSGKSSLAFDTIYAEGQRRYVESLSAYARQFLERMEKPSVDSIEGLSPAVAIEQKNPTKTSRSTVGTATETYDYLRLLWARVGHTFCPVCDREMKPDTAQSAVDEVMRLPEGTRFFVAFPLRLSSEVTHDLVVENLRAQGFLRVSVNGEILNLERVGLQVVRDEADGDDALPVPGGWAAVRRAQPPADLCPTAPRAAWHGVRRIKHDVFECHRRRGGNVPRNVDGRTGARTNRMRRGATVRPGRSPRSTR